MQMQNWWWQKTLEYKFVAGVRWKKGLKTVSFSIVKHSRPDNCACTNGNINLTFSFLFFFLLFFSFRWAKFSYTAVLYIEIWNLFHCSQFYLDWKKKMPVSNTQSQFNRSPPSLSLTLTPMTQLCANKKKK